jgi:hypothetical protein
MMKILEAERWLKGTNSHGVAFLQRWSEKTAVSPIRGLGRRRDTMHRGGRRHGRLTKGVALLLKATPPACTLNRHGLSLLQHASKALPRGAGAGTRLSCRPALSRRSRTVAHDACNHPAVTSSPPLSPEPAGKGGRRPCRRHATAPNGRASPTPDRPARRPKPTRRATSAPGAACEPLRHSLHHRASSIAEPVPRFEATQPTTRQRQPGAVVKRGQKWAGSNDGGRRVRAAGTPSAKLTSHPMGQENPLSRREDDAPVTRTSNGSRTRNGNLANYSPRRINSAARRKALRAGAAGDVSPSPKRPRRKRYATTFNFESFFPFPSFSISCNRDRERGYPQRDPSPRRN